MSISIMKLINRPYKLKDANRILLTNVKITNISQEDSNFLVDFNVLSSDGTKKYKCKILTDSDKINLKTKIKVFCDCMSFKYQYETVLSTLDALYGTSASTKLPKHQNMFICKHLEAFLKLLINLKYLPKFK